MSHVIEKSNTFPVSARSIDIINAYNAILDGVGELECAMEENSNSELCENQLSSNDDDSKEEKYVLNDQEFNLARMEMNMIKLAFKRYHREPIWSLAVMLGISERGLYRKIKEYGMKSRELRMQYYDDDNKVVEKSSLSVTQEDIKNAGKSKIIRNVIEQP